jgi:hypothetical protein
MNAYQQRVNAENLANQAEPVKLAAEDIKTALKTIEQYLYWSIDPEEKDGGAYFAQNLLDHAHELVDRAHAYRAARVANPPPKEDDDEDYFALADAWLDSLAVDDPRRESTVVTRPYDEASRKFLDRWKSTRAA